MYVAKFERVGFSAHLCQEGVHTGCFRKLRLSHLSNVPLLINVFQQTNPVVVYFCKRKSGEALER